MSIPSENETRPGGTRSTSEASGGSEGSSETALAAGGRRPYASPRLNAFGKLQDVTLGGSPGLLDSGAPQTQRIR